MIHHPKLFDEIYLYIDGARENNESDLLNQSKIRNFLQNTSKEGSINFHFNQYNLGLTQHIVAAISAVLQKHSSVVVLEDDVEFDINSLRSIKNQLDVITIKQMPNAVIGMSGLSKQKYFSLAPHNKWRT